MKASKFLFFYFFYLFFNTSYANADFDPLPKSNCTKHNLELKRDYLSIDLEEYQWITNMLKAKLNASEIFKIYKIKKETSLHLPPILQKYKKWKKAKVTYHYKNGLKCTGRGRIRLTGDFTDHLSSKTFIGSFAMRINDFHIYNNTRFKVLYPQSRNHDNEIFINSFFKEIGFLAPDTRSVSVRLGKIGKINMILQDEINKEFLEKNNRVEGPIIESNEFIKWRYARNKTQVEKILPYEVRYSLPKIKNSNWALRTEQNMFDTLLALKALNKVYFQNITDHGKNFRSRYYVYPNFNLINQENHSQFNQLNCINEILKIPHLSILSNRIFYYNYINHSVEPIIYDTNFHISSVIKNKNQNIEDSRCDSDSLKKLLDKVSKINEEKFLEKLSEKGINIKDFKNFLKIKDRILNYPSNDRLKNKPNFEIDKKFVLDFYKNREYNSDNIKKTIVFSNYEKNRSFQICVNKDNCKKLELKKKDIKKLIEGKLKRKNEYFQLVSIENLNPEVLISEKNLNIYKIGNFKDIIIDKKKKLYKLLQKIIIQDYYF